MEIAVLDTRNETMNLTTFNFNSMTVRTTFDSAGNPWFVAADIASILEYSEASAMTRHLDADEKTLVKLTDLSQEQTFIAINESGLYSAILKSRKQEAKAFKKWLTSEVLPSLRETYNIIEALNNFEVPEDVPDMYVYAIKNKDTGNIKLGISKNPEQRLKQLQTGCDGKLELVAYRKADNGYRDELQLHTENEQHAIHGEWFTSDAKFN